MRVVILTILIFLSRHTFSQDVGLEKVDNYVETLKVDKNISVDNLVLSLVKPFASPTLRTRAIYYWIAKNINYDYEGYKTDYWDRYPSEQAILMDTYKFRKGICSGYAHLFKYMLTKAKVECEVVDGYVRADLETVIIGESNHAWNVVRLNNKWHLFDVTWGWDTLKNDVDDFWFKTSPSVFILSHYPENPKWTLLEENISLTDFKNRPIYTRSCLDMSIVSEFSKKGYHQAVNGIVSIDLKTSKDYVWLTKLYDVDKGDWFSAKDVEDRVFEKGFMELSIDRKGKFILRLGVAENLEKGFTIHEELIYLIVENQ